MLFTKIFNTENILNNFVPRKGFRKYMPLPALPAPPLPSLNMPLFRGRNFSQANAYLQWFLKVREHAWYPFLLLEYFRVFTLEGEMENGVFTF